MEGTRSFSSGISVCEPGRNRNLSSLSFHLIIVQTGGLRPAISERTKKIRKMTKRTLAIQAANPAITQNPKIPAMIAITKNRRVHDSIFVLPLYRSVMREIW